MLLNKIDQLEDPSDKIVWVSRCPNAIQISAVTEEGLQELSEEVRLAVIGTVRELTISIPSRASKAIDFLEKRTEVLDRAWEGERSLYKVRIGRNQIEQILSRERDVLINGKHATEAIGALWDSPQVTGACCHIPPHRLDS